MNAKTWIRETEKLQAELNAHLDATSAKHADIIRDAFRYGYLTDNICLGCGRVNCGSCPAGTTTGWHPNLKVMKSPERTQPDQKTMLQNAFRMAASKHRDRPLWAFVRGICGVGSSTARDICHAHDWHPDQIGTMTENKK